MPGPAKAVAYIEIEDYLALENASKTKHEYLDGVIYAVQGDPARGMAGGNQIHSRIIRNSSFALHRKIDGSGCEVLSSEMRLRIEAADAVFYPDVLVHCQATLDPANTMELTDARLVIEVLSPSTQNFDRHVKLRTYQLLPGLQHMLLLSSTEQAAWHCQRLDVTGEWTPLEEWERGSTLALAGLGIGLSWDEVYGGVGLG